MKRHRLFRPNRNPSYEDYQIEQREGPDAPTEDEQRLAADDQREHLRAPDDEKEEQNG